MDLLIATRNSDKFRLAKYLIQASTTGVRVFPLYNTGVTGCVSEFGTTVDRAIQKANYYKTRLTALNRNSEFGALLGIDDGLAIGENEVRPDSHECTDRLLAGEWPCGTSVRLVRSWALLPCNAPLKVETTEIPLVFVGNPAGIKRTPYRYPLSSVLAHEGERQPISHLPIVEHDNFNLVHSGPALKRLFL